MTEKKNSKPVTEKDRKPAEKKGSKKIGRNISNLIYMHGISQNELASKVGINSATISQYINAKRPVKPEHLVIIARFFGISPEMLENGDIPVREPISIDMEKSIAGVKELFPLFDNERTKLNEAFCSALNEQKKILDHYVNLVHTLDDVDFNVIEKGYSKAAEDDEICLEVVANKLAFLMTIVFLNRDNATLAPAYEDLPLMQRKMLDADDDRICLYNRHRSILEKADAKYTEMIKDPDYHSIVMELIKVLKAEKEWSDLADYYIALQFALDAVDNDFNPEQNQVYGNDLMLIFAECDNPYALEYFRLIQSCIK